MPYYVPPKWFYLQTADCRYALFSYRAAELCLEGVDQRHIPGFAVFFGKLLGVLRHQTAAYTVQLPANGGKLDQNFGTVYAVLNHAAHKLYMPDRAGQPVEHRLRLRVYVTVGMRMLVLVQMLVRVHGAVRVLVRMRMQDAVAVVVGMRDAVAVVVGMRDAVAVVVRMRDAVAVVVNVGFVFAVHGEASQMMVHYTIARFFAADKPPRGIAAAGNGKRKASRGDFRPSQGRMVYITT